ncbi:hypothetical protein [Pleomorphovibrio marinus]|uniref:hypothetical protein n=1 Tax=Pleomorphovibrio marinus TaxID=2164132 RepID=UPI000E0B90BC|nr:hypothetical protein [Pleomorphovibrio marinus]
MTDIKLKYNSTYISINLIDELDYVIGGYGKPSAVFIYSLNAFLESFIFSDYFYISVQEAKHFQIVSKAMFPEGRPIFELLSKSKCLMAIGGIGNDIGTVVSMGQFDPKNPTSYQERIQHYIENGLPTDVTRRKYLIIPSTNEDPKEIKYLNIGRVEDGYVATESNNSPEKFYNKLCEVTKHSNVQATLPYYSYEYQLKDIQTRGLGREIISRLSDSFQKRQNKLEEYFGQTNQGIPPLVSILLSQCKSVDDLPENMLQLRKDFANLRNSVFNYEKRINEAENIKEQLDAIDEVNEFWNVFNKKYSKDSRLLYQFWEIADESGYEKSIDKAIDAGDASDMIEDLNVGKVAGKGAKKLFGWYKERRIVNRFRGVTDIWKLFENGPNFKKQLSEFERVFSVRIDENELRQLNKKLKEMKLNTTMAKKT